MQKTNHHILVVDDIDTNRDFLCRRLSVEGYTTAQADGGQACIDMIEKHHFNLVLLDISMPDVTGIMALKDVRKKYSSSRLPIIMVTAIEESQQIVEALNAGANDYVTKPIDFPVLLARMDTHIGLVKAISDRDRVYRTLMKDMKAAARIQQNLLPRTLPDTPQVHFAWKYEPCQTLAGDHLDVFQPDDAHIVVYLLDVSGHGVQAALMTSTLTHVLSSAHGIGAVIWDQSESGLHLAPPGHVARHLNRLFPMDNENCQYFTILYGILELNTGVFRYASAGHPGPVLVPADGQASILVTPGFPIGWVENPRYDEKTVQLKPGDRLYLYCDGITEAGNPEGELFGDDRLTQHLGSARGNDLETSLSQLLGTIKTWTEGQPQDDISILGFELGTG
ncbi:MAG: SpoIIE family protein phosphatase [Verrucomicrobiota bacterium]